MKLENGEHKIVKYMKGKFLGKVTSSLSFSRADSPSAMSSDIVIPQLTYRRTRCLQ